MLYAKAKLNCVNIKRFTFLTKLIFDLTLPSSGMKTQTPVMRNSKV